MRNPHPKASGTPGGPRLGCDGKTETDLRVRRGRPQSLAARDALLLTAGQCRGGRRPKVTRCRESISNFEKGKGPRARSHRLCFTLNSFPVSRSESRPYKPPLPPPNLARNTEPFGMSKGAPGHVFWAPAHISLLLPAAWPEETPLLCHSQVQDVIGSLSPLGVGGGTCRAGWRRASHSGQGSLPEAASGRASRTDSPSGQARR